MLVGLESAAQKSVTSRVALVMLVTYFMPDMSIW
jgi:hypothetical protein